MVARCLERIHLFCFQWAKEIPRINYLRRVTIFPDITLIGQPDNAATELQLSQRTDLDLLVIYDAELPFLERVLAAAGYDAPAHQLHLLRWTADDGGLNLASIIRNLQVKQVMIFGQSLKALGLHFTVAPYFPVSVAGITYLIAPSAAAISAAKAKGDNGPAGNLWRAIKGSFLRPQE